MPASNTYDALHRRLRRQPVSTGKRVHLQERDALWLEKIAEHGPLSSGFLHAFSARMARSSKRARERLTDLFNEANTAHGGPYLTRPWQQFESFAARYQNLVYDLAPAGIAALRQLDRWHELARNHHGPWRHNAMATAITASIDLACRNHPDIDFIPQHRILARAKAQLRFAVPVAVPPSGRSRDIDLIPDAVFGLEYRVGSRTSYRFFVVEADRATEPSKASMFNRKSHWRSFEQYRQYVGAGKYKDHLQLSAGLLVLTVTKDDGTLQRMLQLGEELFPRGNSYLLFRSASEFAGSFRPAEPMPELLDDDWLRIGLPPFRIDRP